MRGEHRAVTPYQLVSSGSSPRARGTHPSLPRNPRGHRFIPACAGNTSSSLTNPTPPPVHPRVRGEHAASAFFTASPAGSSPRARGTQCADPARFRCCRFIPACAGNTEGHEGPDNPITVHPRVRGEHKMAATASSIGDGSSPRARGTHPSLPRNPRGRRFIPACAGNTGQGHERRSPGLVHPRVRGEHSPFSTDSDSQSGSSPRARGTQWAKREPGRRARFIPACAGNTTRPMTPPITVAVHPRVRGEHGWKPDMPNVRAGSSPRARGTLSGNHRNRRA